MAPLTPLPFCGSIERVTCALRTVAPTRKNEQKYADSRDTVATAYYFGIQVQNRVKLIGCLGSQMIPKSGAQTCCNLAQAYLCSETIKIKCLLKHGIADAKMIRTILRRGGSN